MPAFAPKYLFVFCLFVFYSSHFRLFSSQIKDTEINKSFKAPKLSRHQHSKLFGSFPATHSKLPAITVPAWDASVPNISLALMAMCS